MGQAEAQDLGLDGGPLYDPLGNYRRVAGDWNDWSSDPRHPVVATPIATPAEAGAAIPAPATQGVTPPKQ
jgi:outer membrane protein